MGLGYVTDLLRVAPLICWLKTWLNPEITLNHLILWDCVSLDKASCVPWLAYVKSMFGKIEHPDLFNSPERIKKEDVKWIKSHFLNILMMEREELELKKPLVRAHFLTLTSLSIEPHLRLVTKPFHRWLLTRFCFNLIHLTLGTSPGWGKPENLGPCQCDNFSPQDTMHFIMFCEYYSDIRKKFLLPFLRDKGSLQVRPALLYLQMLSNTRDIFHIASFLVAAVRHKSRRPSYLINSV